jgi:hypothetical protein
MLMHRWAALGLRVAKLAAVLEIGGPGLSGIVERLLAAVWQATQLSRKSSLLRKTNPPVG